MWAELRLAFARRAFWSRRADFYDDLAEAQRRKVLVRTFLETQIANARLMQDGALVLVLRQLLRRVGEDSMRRLLATVMPASDSTMLVALDVARDKAACLETMARLIRQSQEARRQLRSRLVQPLVMLPLVGVLVYSLSGAIVQIDQAVSPDAWQGFNAFVRWLALFCDAHWPALILAPALLVVGCVYLLPRWVGRGRLWADRWLFSLYRDWHAMAVLGTLAALLGSGMLLTQALREIAQSGNRWVAFHVRRMLRYFEDRPTDVVGAFNRGLFSPYVVGRFASLRDSSSGVEQALIELGTEETARLAKRFDAAAAAFSGAIVSFLLCIATVLGVGAMTVGTVVSDSTSIDSFVQTQPASQR